MRLKTRTDFIKNMVLFTLLGALALFFMWGLKLWVAPERPRMGVGIGVLLFSPIGGNLLTQKKYLFALLIGAFCIVISIAVGEYLEHEMLTLNFVNTIIVCGIGGLLGLIVYGMISFFKIRF